MNAPASFVCSRQKLTVLKDKREKGDVENGGYLLRKRDNATITLIASGSEVYLCLQAGCKLEKMGVQANIVSVPCFDLLVEQDKSYIDSIIDPSTKALAVEAGAGIEWYRFADEVICMSRFGASSPADKLFKKFGFTEENVAKKACELVGTEYKS